MTLCVQLREYTRATSGTATTGLLLWFPYWMHPAYIDAHLQPFVKFLPSHVQDTNHFLDMIRSLPTLLLPDTIMVIVDVLPIRQHPHTHGLSALKHFLNQRPSHTQPSTQVLIQLTQFILTHNNFSFNSWHFLQIQGTVMGTIWPPPVLTCSWATLNQWRAVHQSNPSTAWAMLDEKPRKNY